MECPLGRSPTHAIKTKHNKPPNEKDFDYLLFTDNYAGTGILCRNEDDS